MTYNFIDFWGLSVLFSQKSYFFLLFNAFVVNNHPFLLYSVFLLLFVYVVFFFSLIFFFFVTILRVFFKRIYNIISFLLLFVLSFFLDFLDFSSVYWSRRKFSFRFKSFLYKWSYFFFSRSLIDTLWIFFFSVLHVQNVFFYFKFAFYYLIRISFKFCFYRLSFFFWWLRNQLVILDLYYYYFKMIVGLLRPVFNIVLQFLIIHCGLTVSDKVYERFKFWFLFAFFAHFFYFISFWLRFWDKTPEDTVLRKNVFFRVFFRFRWCFVVIFFLPVSFLVLFFRVLFNRKFLVIPIFFFKFVISLLFLFLNFLFFFKGYLFNFIVYVCGISWKNYLIHNFVVLGIYGFFIKIFNFLLFLFGKVIDLFLWSIVFFFEKVARKLLWLLLLLFLLKGNFLNTFDLWYYIYDFCLYVFCFISALVSPVWALLPDLGLKSYVYTPFFQITPAHAPVFYPDHFNFFYDLLYQARLWFLFYFLLNFILILSFFCILRDFFIDLFFFIKSLLFLGICVSLICLILLLFCMFLLVDYGFVDQS